MTTDIMTQSTENNPQNRPQIITPDSGLTVLSLFDGMGCGALALHQLGLPVAEYHAYEIDEHAIALTMHNVQGVQEHGDVFDADFSVYKDIDMLIGGSPCFSAGTMIYTDQGYKPIENIEVGDMVLTHMNRFRRVTAIGSKIAPVHELRATGLRPTMVTSNHPYYTRKATKVYKPSTGGMVKGLGETEWTQVKDMECGKTHIGMNILQIEENPLNLDEETCWLLGRYVADGHVRKNKRAKRKDSYQYQFILSVGEDKLDEFKARVCDHHYSCFLHTNSTYRCVFSSMDLVNFVIDHNFGRSCYTKRIPPEIMNLPIPLLKAFLEGYLSGDGCIRGNTVSMCTTSRELALGLQMAIMKVYRRNVSVSEFQRETFCTIEGRVVNQNRQWALSYHPENKPATQGRIIDEQMWTPVKEVSEAVNVMRVYNMSVEEDESYTANNAIVHNCTHWSIAQKKEDRETQPNSGLGWELFSQYVRALREAQPKMFLYENNASMSDAIRDEITRTFGFPPHNLQSSTLSAQSRDRLYWVGRRTESGEYQQVPVPDPEDLGLVVADILEDGWVSPRDKAHAVLTSSARTTHREFFQKAQGDMAMRPVSDAPIRVGDMPAKDGHVSGGQAMRVYSTEGKSRTQMACGGGMGGKTGLYAVPARIDGETVFPVRDGKIMIRGREYPCRLPDGAYEIRKLTVRECARLQTIPDWYDFSVVSNTNAYKAIGNGWTVSVIAHLMSHMLG